MRFHNENNYAIAKSFNGYFSSVGPNLAKEISQIDWSFVTC